MSTLRIYLLGDFRIDDGSEANAALHQSRQQALLTYLLLHRHAPQSRPHLAFLLWPDSTESQALTNLRKALTHVRQAVPSLAPALFADHKVIQWRPAFACWLDVAEFEEKLTQATSGQQAGRANEAIALLSAAVALYTGPLLPSCYDDWIMAERERLHQLCLQALDQLVVVHEHQRDFTAAIHYAQQLLRLDPLQETTYLQLMRLQALQGERAAALRTYHTCATMLERELEVEPGAEMQAAYARLLKLETSVAVRATITSRLVGRQVEWNQLLAAWRQASRYRPHFVCLLGEAGIGKSHLAAELLTWASQQGFAVARTRAYAGEGQLVYAPIIEWLRAEPVRAVRPRVAQPLLSEVARLLPEILTEQPSIPVPAAMTERWQRQQLWEALARTLLAAPQPLCLLLDDLQWCDQETLEWLRYLLHFDPQARLLLLGTARPEEINDAHPLHTLLRHLRSSDQLTEIELNPLNSEQTAALATQVAQQPLTPTLQQALYRATAGNPLFVVETVRAGLSQGVGESSALPPKVQAVIQSRLAQLSPAARDLAHLAAVIGQAFTFDLLVQASSKQEDEVVGALDELWQRHIIGERGTHTYDFSHDRIRDVAYAEVSPVWRPLLHKSVAQAYEALYAGSLDSISNDLGLHYAAAHLWSTASHYYYRAATAAAQVYAFDRVHYYLEQVRVMLDHLPTTQEYGQLRIASWLETAQVLINTKGHTAPEHKQALDNIYELAKQFGTEHNLLQAKLGLRGYYGNLGNWYMAYALSQETIDHAEKLQEPKSLRSAYRLGGHACLQRGDFLSSLEYYQKVRQLDETYNPERKHSIGNDKSLIAYISGYDALSPYARSAESLWFCGYPAQAQQILAKVMQAIDEQPHPFNRVHIGELLLYAAQRRGDVAVVERIAAEMLAVCEKYSFPNYALVARIFNGCVLVQRGAAEQGLLAIQEAIAEQQQIGDRFNLPYFLSLMAEAQAQVGQLPTALVTFEQALRIVEETGDCVWKAELLRLAGDWRNRLNPYDPKVESLYTMALDVARQQRAKMLELRAATSLARLWQQQGRAAEAYQLLAEIYHWFTEGFDTVDLKTARTLLGELSQ